MKKLPERKKEAGLAGKREVDHGMYNKLEKAKDTHLNPEDAFSSSGPEPDAISQFLSKYKYPLIGGGLAGAGLLGYGAYRLASKKKKEKPRAKEENSKQSGVKHAGPYPDMQSVAVQSYAPISGKRKLSPEEDKNVEKGESRWLPKIFKSYSTPSHELLASPLKQALLAALLGGAAGAGIGGLSTMRRGGEFSPLGAGIGGAIGAVPSGLLGYFGRKQENENLKDLISRLPRGSTYRDILSDPVRQSELDRIAYMSGRNRPGLMVGLGDF